VGHLAWAAVRQASLLASALRDNRGSTLCRAAAVRAHHVACSRKYLVPLAPRPAEADCRHLRARRGSTGSSSGISSV
jgi:hypothetical protein